MASGTVLDEMIICSAQQSRSMKNRLSAIALFVACYPCCCCHHCCCPCSLCCHCHFCLPTTLATIAITLAALTLFVVALIICHMLSLFIIACCCGCIYCPSLTLPLLVDCFFFTPPAKVGGVWRHHLPLLLSGLVQLPLVVALKICCQGRGVAAAAKAIPVSVLGQWPYLQCWALHA
jgi:hypothetical protein